MPRETPNAEPKWSYDQRLEALFALADRLKALRELRDEQRESVKWAAESPDRQPRHRLATTALEHLAALTAELDRRFHQELAIVANEVVDEATRRLFGGP